MTSVALEIDGKQVNGVSAKENEYMQNWIVNTVQHTIGPPSGGGGDGAARSANQSRRSQRKRKKTRETRGGNLVENGVTNEPKLDLLTMYAKYLTPLIHPRNESTNSDTACRRCPCSNPLNASNLSLPLPVSLLRVPSDVDANNRTVKHLNRRKRQPRRICQVTAESDVAKFANSKTSSTDEFASLPPFADSKDSNNSKKNNRRRFSDPGFAVHQQSTKKNAPKPSNPNDSLIMCLVDHINLLKECNKNLHKELNKTNDDLETLKQQLSIWRGESVSSQGQTRISSATAYAPGMLADLVREIRDAAKVREEAMYSKVRLMLEEKISNKNHVQSPQTDKSKINERLMHLEEELQNLRLSQSKDSISAYSAYPNVHLGGVVGRLSSLEHDHMRLQLELNKEQHAHAAADARANKLEMLVTQLQAKRGGTYTPVHANGTSTPDPRHLVMGPITDL